MFKFRIINNKIKIILKTIFKLKLFGDQKTSYQTVIN